MRAILLERPGAHALGRYTFSMKHAIERLRSQLRHAVGDDPWHGPALAVLLEGMSAEQAAAKPIAGAHSIWELVLHVTAWHREVLRRLDGRPPSMPEAGDWPEPPASRPQHWQAAVADLHRSQAELDAALARLDAADLERPVGTLREPALGTGFTLGETVLGLLQHDAYHGGQIALVRRALGVGA